MRYRNILTRTICIHFYLIILAITCSPSLLVAKTPPDEQSIFFHIHQATQWAELSFSRNCLLSMQEIKNHLESVKYKNPRLVDSKFYSDYLILRDLAFGDSDSNLGNIEALRARIHIHAEDLKLNHEETWDSEFLACSR